MRSRRNNSGNKTQFLKLKYPDFDVNCSSEELNNFIITIKITLVLRFILFVGVMLLFFYVILCFFKLIVLMNDKPWFRLALDLYFFVCVPTFLIIWGIVLPCLKHSYYIALVFLFVRLSI